MEAPRRGSGGAARNWLAGLAGETVATSAKKSSSVNHDRATSPTITGRSGATGFRRRRWRCVPKRRQDGVAVGIARGAYARLRASTAPQRIKELAHWGTSVRIGVPGQLPHARFLLPRPFEIAIGSNEHLMPCATLRRVHAAHVRVRYPRPLIGRGARRFRFVPEGSDQDRVTCGRLCTRSGGRLPIRCPVAESTGAGSRRTARCPSPRHRPRRFGSHARSALRPDCAGSGDRMPGPDAAAAPRDARRTRSASNGRHRGACGKRRGMPLNQPRRERRGRTRSSPCGRCDHHLRCVIRLVRAE